VRGKHCGSRGTPTPAGEGRMLRTAGDDTEDIVAEALKRESNRQSRRDIHMDRGARLHSRTDYSRTRVVPAIQLLRTTVRTP